MRSITKIFDEYMHFKFTLVWKIIHIASPNRKNYIRQMCHSGKCSVSAGIMDINNLWFNMMIYFLQYKCI